jgi:pentapeptide MXKDX repeat protein
MGVDRDSGRLPQTTDIQLPRGLPMSKLLTAVLAAVFAVVTVSPVAFAQQKMEETKAKTEAKKKTTTKKKSDAKTTADAKKKSTTKQKSTTKKADTKKKSEAPK